MNNEDNNILQLRVNLSQFYKILTTYINVYIEQNDRCKQYAYILLYFILLAICIKNKKQNTFKMSCDLYFLFL